MHPSRRALSIAGHSFRASHFYRSTRAPSAPAPARVTFTHRDLNFISRELHKACQYFSIRKWIQLDNAPFPSRQAKGADRPRPRRAGNARKPIQRLCLSSLASTDRLTADARRWLRVAYSKGPINAYVSFLQDVRKQVRKANPDLHFVQRWKIIADMYRRLPTYEKNVYREKAIAFNRRYRLPLFQ
ncbi:hypothetical protein XU18_2819 [Perkinsela sp. CCAP 1560/4]|nr:hypothetical protein XU18_2819 [Perkinsela sp. CCAP 1560/4]|eukprot:KNH06314.1 hypothetical protein XU18_2819 [Perkinsela sp. CCAP 1560/4]